MLEPQRDFLVIYDGDSPAAPLLIRFSGIHNDTSLVISTQSHLYVYFFSNYAVSGKGFTIDYRAGKSVYYHLNEK